MANAQCGTFGSPASHSEELLYHLAFALFTNAKGSK